MTAYITIADADVDEESPIDEYLKRRLRDNVLAIAEGSSGAPIFVNAALGDSSVHGGTDLADNTITTAFMTASAFLEEDFNAAVGAQLYNNGWYHSHSGLSNSAVSDATFVTSFINLTFQTYSSWTIASGTQMVIPQGFYNITVNSTADRANGDYEIYTPVDGIWHGRECPSAAMWSDGSYTRFNNRSGGNVTYYYQRLR